ncbi:MAG TPA: hypothetical protein PKW08_12330 [Flavobacteriaceae bacterium]|nr:hypothetical protein [Flavobacteriaceae bacterium]MCB9213444.1 hypothetical protein [Alteromonas sp.]HPF12509.1 hypothetical protein [Flavobacteriaceae bacterium]HQU22366.1 hypothetical protein [Flavobacteriaceae bacterium]HQU66303.1 hypothetical protein [Flavobacteriaceae bacterium]
MKTLFLLIGLLVATSGFAQNDEAYVNQLTNQFTQKLGDRGIHDYFVAKRYCSGTIEMFKIAGKMCTSKGTYYEVYVVWNDNGKDYMKKIDNCGLFHSQELSDTSLTDFYKKEWPAIKDDEVKPYASESYTGEPELRKKVQPCYRDFQFQMGEVSTTKSFNLFAIGNDSEGKNRNYTFNQTLKLVQLNTLMDDVLSSLVFKRQE